MNHVYWAMAWTLLAGIAVGGVIAVGDRPVVVLVLVAVALASALRGHWHAMQDAGSQR